MLTTNAEVLKNGVHFLPELISAKKLLVPTEGMHMQIDCCAREINCSRSQYLSSVSRWASPSAIIEPFTEVIRSLHKKLESYLNQSIKLTKTNVICKNQYACDAIPFHQDIAYHTSPKEYYSFTCWLSLSTITTQDGPLLCFPEPSNGVIEPAVDFWGIDFIDQKALDKNFVEKVVSYPCNIGDAVLFNAYIWHGSQQSQTKHDRYALVTRWLIEEDVPLHFNIPTPVSGKFGMWCCHNETIKILSALLDLFSMSNRHDDTGLMVDKLIIILPELNWVVNIEAAKYALQRLKTLHMASKLHNAGDSQGVVYKTLWHSLLKDSQEQIAKMTRQDQQNPVVIQCSDTAIV